LDTTTGSEHTDRRFMNVTRTVEMDSLLEKFVARFNVSATVESSRDCGVIGAYEGDIVRREITPHRTLEQIYSEIPFKFPPLYERLVLTYRWYRSELDVFETFNYRSGLNTFDIFGNPQGSGLNGLREVLFGDSALTETCLPKGYVQFGSGPNGLYDPICFDTSRKNAKQDFAIVQLDHEAIHCRYKIKIVQTIAPSFESLVNTVLSAPLRSEEI
jgi:hypothetical protein